MDPMCLSLVQQFLDDTNSSLADQFRHKYESRKTNVEYKEVLLKWKADQLTRSLVHNYLKTVSPALTNEFKVKYQPEKTRLQLTEVLSKWKEKQLARGVVLNHLRTVVPSLAVEFENKHKCSVKLIPKQLIGLIQRTLPAVAGNVITRPSTDKKDDEGKQELRTNRFKVNTFTREEILRIQRAIAMKEDVGALAKEMGRNYKSVVNKIRWVCLQSSSIGMKRGKYSAEEVKRVRLAVKNNEDFKIVARELNRAPELVQMVMYHIANDPNYGTEQAKKSFSVEEDLLLLDKVIMGMDVTKLSCVGTIPSSISTKVAKETARPLVSIRIRWDEKILPWLLQHYSGTTGFRVERMLTSLIAEKFSDSKGINWSEIVKQHPEFVGHTAHSLSRIFRTAHAYAKAAKKGAEYVSLQEVADYASAVYQPGKERKESPATIAHREAVISHFKRKVAELGINVGL